MVSFEKSEAICGFIVVHLASPLDYVLVALYSLVDVWTGRRLGCFNRNTQCVCRFTILLC